MMGEGLCSRQSPDVISRVSHSTSAKASADRTADGRRAGLSSPQVLCPRNGSWLVRVLILRETGIAFLTLRWS
jgi:hypothetical protein